MSAGLGAIARSAGQIADVLFMSNRRSIGPFVPHVTLEEQHRDDSVITEFPVEVGAAITDHTYERPPTLVMRVGWSDSSAQQNGYIKSVYRDLLALKAKRKPFSISTGKRLYDNMLFIALDVVTDARSEHTLMLTAAFKKVILTRTQTASGGGSPDATAKVGEGAPAGTQPVTDRGALQPSEASLQNFAGAYNPGSGSPVGPGTYQVEGSAGSLTFGLGGPNPAAASPVDMGQMSGISPPTEITLPQISAGPETVSGLQGAGPDQYRVFGVSP